MCAAVKRPAMAGGRRAGLRTRARARAGPDADAPPGDDAFGVLLGALEAAAAPVLAGDSAAEDKGAPHRAWEVPGVAGYIRAWRGGAVAHAVRYGYESARGRSAGLAVWLDASVDAVTPHLAAHVAVGGGRCVASLDHLPRVDLALAPEYAEAFYGGAEAERWAELRCASDVLDASAPPSRDFAVRALQGPNVLVLSADAADAAAVRALASALTSHVEAWRAFRAEPRAEADADAVGARDISVRRQLRDHEARAGEKLLGEALARELAAAMAGPGLS